MNLKTFFRKRSFGLSDVINEGDVPDFWEQEQTLEEFMEENPKAIRLKDLGNKCIEEIIENLAFLKKEIAKNKNKEYDELEIEYADYIQFEEGTEEGLLKEIAMACIGKKTVEKKLNEAKIYEY
jgi:hypothetical protein